MTLDDIKKYYVTGYRFQKITGLPRSNFWNWGKQGFIPIKTQIKLQELTKGALKASLDDLI